MTARGRGGQRGRVAVAAGVTFALYALASWLEAAERPADFGYDEPLSWSRMFGALPLSSWSDVARLELPPFCLVAMLGMAGTLAWTAFPPRQSRALERVQVALVWTYTLALVLAGGWLCVVVLPFELVESHDGECLQDGGLRMLVVGVWTIECLVASWSVRHLAAAPDAVAARRT